MHVDAGVEEMDGRSNAMWSRPPTMRVVVTVSWSPERLRAIDVVPRVRALSSVTAARSKA